MSRRVSPRRRIFRTGMDFPPWCPEFFRPGLSFLLGIASETAGWIIRRPAHADNTDAAEFHPDSVLQHESSVKPYRSRTIASIARQERIDKRSVRPAVHEQRLGSVARPRSYFVGCWRIAHAQKQPDQQIPPQHGEIARGHGRRVAGTDEALPLGLR